MSLFDSASLIVTPNGYKEDKLYSIKPTDGSGDLVVTRATTATRVNSDGLIEQVPYNLLKYSQQFTNAIWTPRNGTFTDNFTTAPNGTTTACKWVATDTDPYIYQSYNGANIDYTATCWVKATGTAIGKNCSIRVGASAVFTAMTGEWQQLTITANINGSVNVGVEAPESATSGEIVYIWGFQLVEGTSAKEYFPTTDRLDVPRLDYTNSSCPSILVEPQRTNLCLRSQEFDNASWLTFRSSVTANATISPDGNTNAEKLIQESTTTDSGGIYQNLSLSNSTVYTYSVYLKAAGYNFGLLRVNGSKYAWFDLSNGVVGSITGGGSSSIQNVGNGWYKCIFTFTTTSTVGEPHIYIAQTNGSSIVSSADGVKGIFAYGAQLEQGSYATSYVPTIASSVTRNADVISKTGISSLIGQTEGTMFVDFVWTKVGKTYQSITLGGTSNYANCVYFFTTESSGTARFQLYIGGVTLISDISTTFTNGTRYKVALAYKSGSIAFYVNGVSVGTSSATYGAVSEAISQLLYNWPYGGDEQWCSPINTTAIWKTRLSNETLAQLTTI